jgi:hypothetical protein
MESAVDITKSRNAEESGRTWRRKLRYGPYGIYALILLACAFAIMAGEIFAAEPAPYPPSSLIRDITWHWETHQTAAEGSDLWPTTWGPDDHLYTAWGDGGGFGGSGTEARVSLGFARIEGGPERFRGININGGKNAEHPATFPKKGKTVGILFDHDTLYTSINLQDGRWPDVNHVLAWSNDKGATWTQADWRFGKGPGTFEPAKFVSFGKDGSGIPSALAGYIYVIGPKYEATSTGRGNSLFLARVATKTMTQSNAVEFFARTAKNNKPLWQSEFAKAQPIFTDSNGIAPGSIVYNRGVETLPAGVFPSRARSVGSF